jgi:hypothetical protein
MSLAWQLLSNWSPRGSSYFARNQGGNMERSYRNDIDWRDLCEQASKEQDSEKLIEIVQRLNEVLEQRRRPIRPALHEVPGPCDGSRATLSLSY